MTVGRVEAIKTERRSNSLANVTQARHIPNQKKEYRRSVQC